jgi:hypothetical protein
VWEAQSAAPSKLLEKIRTLLAGSSPSIQHVGDWLLPIAYPALLVSEYTRTNPSTLLGADRSRAIVVGYEDGDFLPVRLEPGGG